MGSGLMAEGNGWWWSDDGPTVVEGNRQWVAVGDNRGNLVFSQRKYSHLMEML